MARRKGKIPVAVEQARKDAKQRGRDSIGKAATPGQLQTLKCDVSKEEDIINAFKWVKEHLGGVDILINNAGVPGASPLTSPNTAEWRNILDVNVLGLSICTREALQQMKARGVDDGHIIHIGSRLGHGSYNVPGCQLYGAAKHGVRVLTEGLRKELVAAKSRVRVTEVSPGVVQTEIFDKVPKDLVAKTLGLADTDFWLLPHLKSEDVADAVLYALSSPPHVQIHELIVASVGEAL